jgi:hypothetical protein
MSWNKPPPEAKEIPADTPDVTLPLPPADPEFWIKPGEVGLVFTPNSPDRPGFSGMRVLGEDLDPDETDRMRYAMLAMSMLIRFHRQDVLHSLVVAGMVIELSLETSKDDDVIKTGLEAAFGERDEERIKVHEAQELSLEKIIQVYRMARRSEDGE